MDPNLKKGESPHASFQCFTEYYFWRYFFLFLVCNFLYAVCNIILYRIFYLEYNIHKNQSVFLRLDNQADWGFFFISLQQNRSKMINPKLNFI